MIKLSMKVSLAICLFFSSTFLYAQDSEEELIEKLNSIISTTERNSFKDMIMYDCNYVFSSENIEFTIPPGTNIYPNGTRGKIEWNEIVWIDISRGKRVVITTNRATDNYRSIDFVVTPKRGVSHASDIVEVLTKLVREKGLSSAKIHANIIQDPDDTANDTPWE